MNRLVLSLKIALAAAALFGAAALIAPAPGQAATVDIPFDYVSGNSTPSAVVTGTAGGTLQFTLTISDPDVAGSFAMDAYANPGFPAGSYLGRIDLFGSPASHGPSIDYGAMDFATVPGGILAFTLASENKWTLTVLSSDYPIYLEITSSLFSFTGADFSALLSVNVPDDIIVTPTETPLPAALPLFATGLGVLGFAAHRRRKRAL